MASPAVSNAASTSTSSQSRVRRRRQRLPGSRPCRPQVYSPRSLVRAITHFAGQARIGWEDLAVRQPVVVVDQGSGRSRTRSWRWTVQRRPARRTTTAIPTARSSDRLPLPARQPMHAGVCRQHAAAAPPELRPWLRIRRRTRRRTGLLLLPTEPRRAVRTVQHRLTGQPVADYLGSFGGSHFTLPSSATHAIGSAAGC